MSWSPFTPEVLEDPANGHGQLLSACPVHKCEDFDPPFYTLSLYEDVEWALRETSLFSSEFGQGPRFSDPVGMLCDPPQHTYIRKLVQQAFTPRAMAALQPQIEEVTHNLVDQILQGEIQFDLHDDFAFPLPVIIIAQLLGIPTEDLEKFKRWSDIQVAAMGAEDPTPFLDDQAQFFAYMENHFLARRSQLEKGSGVPEDLLTVIASGKDPSGELLSHENAMSVLMQLLVGGNETTTSLITNLMWRLLQDPKHWQAVTADDSLIDVAIEESLRFDPPVLGLYRNTTADVELHDQVIPAGMKVFINYAAANRDPSVFPQPNNFKLDRPHKRHMSFGLGLHFCLGAPMARLEAQIAVKVLAERLPEISLVGSGERIAPFFLWGRKRLPILRES